MIIRDDLFVTCTKLPIPRNIRAVDRFFYTAGEVAKAKNEITAKKIIQYSKYDESLKLNPLIDKIVTDENLISFEVTLDAIKLLLESGQVVVTNVKGEICIARLNERIQSSFT